MKAFAHDTVIAVPDRAELRDALVVWAQISAAGIGGAALQLATMHRLLVQEKRWIAEDRFFHALSYCIALPGPETQQLSIYVGWLVHRVIGGVIAGGLFILPGMICMMALSFGYVSGGSSPLAHAISLGIRPAIIAVMLQAIIRFGRHVIHSRGLSGWPERRALLALLADAATAEARGRQDSPEHGWPYWPSPRSLPRSANVRPTLRQFVRSLTFWLMMWLAPPIALLVLVGPGSIYTQISLLFGKVALMAVGGDYAVIAYAAREVVASYHWLSAREVQEGIAMGEMVPGTIMIVTQFFGFMAAYRDPGTLSPLAAGTCGGLLATWMTFCPCFLFIMVVAPFIEGLRRNVLLNSALQAVTAGAVGMILNLSVWFGLRTLFTDVQQVHYWRLKFDLPEFASADLWALLLFVCAALAMLKFKVGTVQTLLASSAAGVLLVVSGLAG